MTDTPTATPTKRNGYSLKQDLNPIIQGKVELPNFKEKPVEDAAADIFRFGSSIRGNARLPGSGDAWAPWAQYFLDTGQGGQLYGSGLVVFSSFSEGRSKARAGTFAICEHVKVDDPGANHMRGWHPGHCKKCGLDMTVDSGD